MIRRAMTTTLAAVALVLGVAACSADDDSATKDTAVEFMTAFAGGDEAKMCDLATKKVGDCTTGASVELKEQPTADDEVFENKETGTVAVVVTYTTVNKPGKPDTYAVEIREDGKVTQWEAMSNQPKNRNTVAMVLGWSE